MTKRLLSSPHTRALAAAILMLLPAVAGASDVPGCGSLANAYGPFDYTDAFSRRERLPIVEHHHFNSDVEALRRGMTGKVLDDLDYTLRAFPNHHRALRSIARYALTGGKFPIDSAIPSADCYFQRAVVFQPNDEMTRAIYADYLSRRGDREGAAAQYETALQLAPESAEINYVAGLFFLSTGDIERAEALAAIAYGKGHPLPGLRDRIADEKRNRAPQRP